MFAALPKGWFSSDYQITDPNGYYVDIHQNWFGESGTLNIQGMPYRVYREGLWGSFVLEGNGQILASATKAMFRSFTLTFNNAVYELKARPMQRAFDLSINTMVIGSVSPQGIFSRKIDADLPSDIPFPVQVFIVWLVLILWRRSQQAAAASH